MNELIELDIKVKREKYKNVPEFALPKMKLKTSTANGLTQSIIKWLELNGHYCSRIQSQGQYNPTLGQWTKSTVKRGIGDLMTVINGKSVMIEIKIGKDRQSEWQRSTQKEVEASGGLYFIAKDFDSFLTFYKSITNDRK
jgi:hypothetical protein